MNLAITDLLFLLFSVPLTIYLGIRKFWIFGEFMCKTHIYIAHVCYILLTKYRLTTRNSLGSITSDLLYISCYEYRSIFEYSS
jgi:hypothetical protein